jgi:hypothetical protein
MFWYRSNAKEEGPEGEASSATCRDIRAAGQLVYRTHLYYLPYCPPANISDAPITLGMGHTTNN